MENTTTPEPGQTFDRARAALHRYLAELDDYQLWREWTLTGGGFEAAELPREDLRAAIVAARWGV